MHLAAAQFFSSNLRELNPGHVLEIGSININGSVRDYFPQSLSWWGIDIIGGPCVDEVADGADWRSSKTFDIAICAEVFEHTPKWREIIINMHRHLVNGGLLLASCASRDRPPHSANGDSLMSDEFYQNVNPPEMHELLSSMAWTSYDVIEANGHYGNDDLYIKCVK